MVEVDESTENHHKGLGKLVANMQSLEFVLRAFLSNDEIAKGHSFNQSSNLNNLSIGDTVRENAFTNYDALGKLISKYNEHPRILSTELNIDETLCYIRDAVAHGRISSNTSYGPMKLLKFSKPKNNQVKVTLSVTMTKEWFKEQTKRSYGAILKVSEANERLQNKKL